MADDEVAARQPSGRRVAIVPHTHWDREWYLPFQTFRLRLVDLLDELIPTMEADPSYRHFLLDGQMAVVDDYLAVRPEKEAALRRLAVSGRLAMGPWYILMDEFLVSGETMVRNLQRGLERAAAFGGAMEVGYLPDMFGHVAQMPQLLRQAGFEHAVVWRGVPSAVDRSAFWWSAPDGSSVRAEYLPQGYGNGARVPDDAKALVARIAGFEAEQAGLLGAGEEAGPILWMNGTDHLLPQPWLGRVVAEANDVQSDYRLEVTGLAAYVRTAPVDGLPAWTGELRSGARANLLMGVASNRVDVKQACARAERELEQLAEPLSALFLPASQWPGALLDEAWLAVIRNSAHDSVCACSVDEVCDAVLHRYAEARQIAEGLTRRAVDAVGGDGSTVVNPSARTRSGLVELIVPGDGEPPLGAQVLSQRPAEFELAEFGSPQLAAGIVSELEYQARFLSVTVIADDGRVLAHAERERGGALVTPELRAQLKTLSAAPPPGVVRVRCTQAPTQKVLARIEAVPGFGWRTWEPSELDVLPVVAAVDPTPALANGLVTVSVDPANGTFAIDGFPGYGRLVDGGDVGDTYNWCPPADDELVEEPESVSTSVVEAGPVRGRISIAAQYLWRGVPINVHTTVELRAGERLVRVSHAFVNRARDHRLRAWIPLRHPAVSSEAECAFAIVTRGLEAQGGPTELGLPTYPSRRFVRAGGVTVVHEGLLEYELVDLVDGAAHALALTLLRCTGLLSQGPMLTRPRPAGPITPMEGPQMQKPVEVRYGVCVGDADPYALVEDAFVPLQVAKRAAAPAAARTAATGQALSITGVEVSAVTRRGAGAPLTVRVFNPTPEATVARIEGHRGWLVDLRGRPVAPFEQSFTLDPWRIATAIVAD